jgi:hypothetical protein
MAKLGRPFMYQSEEERPVTLSVRVPRELAARLKRYAQEHRRSVTEVILEGIAWRLEPPSDPRDLIVSDNSKTVMQQLQPMVAALVHEELGKRSLDALARATDAIHGTRDDIPHYDNTTVIQENEPHELTTYRAQMKATLEGAQERFQETQQEGRAQTAQPTDDIPHYNSNTVIQDNMISQGQRVVISQKKRRKDALPLEHLQAIARERQHQPALTLREFAAYLFEQGLYRGQGKQGEAIPASSSLVHKWLKEAHEAGLL